MENHRQNRCICNEMKQLMEEQDKLSFEGFRFVCESIGFDTIPFILSNGEGPFEAWGRTMNGRFFITPVFRIESLDERHCCAKLSLLEPVDMDGCPVELCDEVFSLLKTEICIVVDLKCFCSIQPLSPKLVNRPLPIIEPKC